MTPGGPFLEAKPWSHHAGKRHQPTETITRTGHAQISSTHSKSSHRHPRLNPSRLAEMTRKITCITCMSGRNPTLQSASEVVPAALVEHPANHGLKERQWLGVVAGIEGVLVVVRAEVDGGLVVLVVTPAVTDVAIHPGVVEVVIALEHPVVLDDP